MTNDVVEGLQKIRDQVFERLQHNPEYRALRAIDKTINDIIAIAEMPMARPNGMSQSSSRRDVDEQIQSADVAFAPPRPVASKANAAPLFPAHRVA
jgi:hypothetical protein